MGVSTADGFARARDAARRTGTTGRVHLKVDTGLGRGGFTPAQLREFLGELGDSDAADVQIVGLMSHLANADLPGDPATHQQKDVFAAVHGVLADFLAGPGRPFAAPGGLMTHTANSPGALGDDDVPGDTVRVGLSLYGLSPFEQTSAQDLGLRPAMSLVSRVLTVKRRPRRSRGLLRTHVQDGEAHALRPGRRRVRGWDPPSCLRPRRGHDPRTPPAGRRSHRDGPDDRRCR